MSKYIRFLPLVLLLCYLGIKVLPYLKVPDGPTGYTPTPSQVQLLAPVSAVLVNHPSAAENFSNMFYGLALVVESDDVILKTTDDVRRAHQNAGALAIQVGEVPRVLGYSEAVDSFIDSQMGRDNVPLDAATRKQLADTFKALAWATKQ